MRLSEHWKIILKNKNYRFIYRYFRIHFIDATLLKTVGTIVISNHFVNRSQLNHRTCLQSWVLIQYHSGNDFVQPNYCNNQGLRLIKSFLPFRFNLLLRKYSRTHTEMLWLQIQRSIYYFTSMIGTVVCSYGLLLMRKWVELP